ncbi:MAG: Eco57I restriction-modification methylase domain-containing protein [Pseudomonadota bacterium]
MASRATSARRVERRASTPLNDRLLASVRSEAHSLASTAAEESRIAFARSFCDSAVRTYWSEAKIEAALPAAPKLYRLSRPAALDGAAAEIASRLGALLALLRPAEVAYQLGSLYCTMLPPELRARHGIFYTPPALAERLLDQAETEGLDWRTARVLDPATGSGAFLIPAARRMAQAMAGADAPIIVQSVTSRLRGRELDPFTAWLAEVFVTSELRAIIAEARRSLGRIVDHCDSLDTAIPVDLFDLVVGNPPYGRVRLTAEKRARYERSLYGHANLYGLFLDLATRLTRGGGLISYLTPASFLAGEYFKNLRAVLWHDAPPCTIEFVALRKGVFEGVLQETILATYRRGAKRRLASVNFLEWEDGTGIQARPAGKFDLPEEPSAPWLLPREAGAEELSAKLRRMSHKLADWGYSVSTGPLVWNRHKSQLHDKPGPNRIPLIWAESVTSDGRFVLRCEKRNHKPYFELKAGDEWLVVRRPCILLQRTTAKEQSRRLIAAEMPRELLKRHDGVTVENHLNMLLPLLEQPPVSLPALAAFLNTKAADRAFRCMSGSVAVSAYELESLPLPPPSALKRLERMLAKSATPAAIEVEVGRLFSCPSVE